MPASPPNVANLLWDRLPELVARFRVYRDRTAEWCHWARSEAREDESGEGTGAERLRLLQAVTNVFELLGRREWTADEVIELKRLLPDTLRLGEFRDCLGGAERQVAEAVRQAAKTLKAKAEEVGG